MIRNGFTFENFQFLSYFDMNMVEHLSSECAGPDSALSFGRLINLLDSICVECEKDLGKAEALPLQVSSFKSAKNNLSLQEIISAYDEVINLLELQVKKDTSEFKNHENSLKVLFDSFQKKNYISAVTSISFSNQCEKFVNSWLKSMFNFYVKKMLLAFENEIENGFSQEVETFFKEKNVFSSFENKSLVHFRKLSIDAENYFNVNFFELFFKIDSKQILSNGFIMNDFKVMPTQLVSLIDCHARDIVSVELLSDDLSVVETTCLLFSDCKKFTNKTLSEALASASIIEA